MDAFKLIENEVDTFVEKISYVERNLAIGIDHQIAVIEKLQRDIVGNNDEGGPYMSSAESDMVKKAMCEMIKTVSEVVKGHKECRMLLWKIGKAVDKSFLPGSISFFPGYSSDELSSLLDIVLEHLARDGRLDICRSLVKESGIESEFEAYVELNKVVEALKARDVGPALDWVIKNRDNLDSGCEKRNTEQISLELRLHRLKFLDILKHGDRQEGIKYAQKNFPFLISDQETGVLSLMGAIMYSGSALEKSPYGYLTESPEWEDTADLLLRSACSLLGVSIESPLLAAVNAGCLALPDMILSRQILQKSGQEKVPVDVELSEEFSFHSVFVCPVLRQQVSENNHPMKLECGHVISRIALAKLVKPGLRVSKLKCPSCRRDQNPAKARRIFF